MTTTRWTAALALVLAVLVAASGCSKKNVETTPDRDRMDPGAAATDTGTDQPMTDESGTMTLDEAMAMIGDMIFFDFDRSDLRPEARTTGRSGGDARAVETQADILLEQVAHLVRAEHQEPVRFRAAALLVRDAQQRGYLESQRAERSPGIGDPDQAVLDVVAPIVDDEAIAPTPLEQSAVGRVVPAGAARYRLQVIQHRLVAIMDLAPQLADPHAEIDVFEPIDV